MEEGTCESPPTTLKSRYAMFNTVVFGILPGQVGKPPVVANTAEYMKV